MNLHHHGKDYSRAELAALGLRFGVTWKGREYLADEAAPVEISGSLATAMAGAPDEDLEFIFECLSIGITPADLRTAEARRAAETVVNTARIVALRPLVAAERERITAICKAHGWNWRKRSLYVDCSLAHSHPRFEDAEGDFTEVWSLFAPDDTIIATPSLGRHLSAALDRLGLSTPISFMVDTKGSEWERNNFADDSWDAVISQLHSLD